VIRMIRTAIDGGELARPIPSAVGKLREQAPERRVQADWGRQWLWNQPEVSSVLRGMSTRQHVEENLASADRSGARALTDDDLRVVGAVQKAHRGLAAIPPVRGGRNVARMCGSINRRGESRRGRTGRASVGSARELWKARRSRAARHRDLKWLKKAHAPLSGEE